MKEGRTTSDDDANRRQRARLRRLDRMKTRSLSAARKACLACPLMGLLWVLGYWYDIPTWVVAVSTLGLLVVVALVSKYAMRGRTIREPLES